MQAISEAIALLKAHSIADPRVDRAPTKEELVIAESALGCQFPPSFRAFLQEAGALALPYWETYWIEPCKRGGIVKANRIEHEEAGSPLPEYLITFMNDGMGNQICFDTRTMNTNGEYPIVFWDHELDPEENLANLAPLAATFEEWLLGEVKNQIS